jgi:hypothetical protein
MTTYRKASFLCPVMVILMLLGLPAYVPAGDLDSPTAPAATSSYTLENLYNRLNDGTAGSQSTFTEPAAGPTVGTMHTINEIMGKAPAVDDANGAAAPDVLSGKTYWGLLTGGGWGLKTGSLATQTPDNTTVSQPAGYYDAFNLSTVDSDLKPSNIRLGVTIFGVTGTIPPGCVAKTGQTACYNALGTEIDCSGSGQDGEYQKGCAPAAEPDLGADFDGYNRTSFPCSAGFTDNGNGTVTDNLTGLIWLKNANYNSTGGGTGTATWADALSFCNSLQAGQCGLTDGSSAGDWRLPNINELRSLFDPSRPAPYLPDGAPFTGVQSSYYWSSTTYANGTSDAWIIHLNLGHLNHGDKQPLPFSYVWPVRGGQ